jgi:uncharacterized protein YbjT (DUF2867 family)
MRVLVLGGNGFIGQHVVQALLARGHGVAIGGRRGRSKHAACPAAAARLDRLTEPGAWASVVDGFDAVINCVGILRERGRETYERVHCQAPAALAQACERAGVRFIHVSALGLHADARSRFIRSKLQGEAAVRASGGDWSIVRPSLLDGEGGFGARWLRALARLPVHCTPAVAQGRIAALDVRDLGEAIAVLCERSGAGAWREVELGGIEHFTMAQLLAALRRRHTARPARSLAVPQWLARPASHLCDLLHWSPYSFGHLELMRQDNLPGLNRLPALLGRAPRPVGIGTRPAAEPVPAFS